MKKITFRGVDTATDLTFRTWAAFFACDLVTWRIEHYNFTVKVQVEGPNVYVVLS